MHVLLTGVAGFIGSHLARRCLERGDRVTGIDSFHAYYDVRQKRAAVAPLLDTPGFRLVEGDIRDPAALAAFFSSPGDVVVHLAALVGVRSSLDEAAEYVDVNVRGSVLILEEARRHGIDRLVLASSSSVYGEGAPAPFREDGPVGLPLSPYAASKRAMELMAAAAQQLYGLRVALLRFFTVYGPGQRPDLAIHKFARRILAGQPIPVFGDGSSRRDYTYVSDIVAGIEGAITWTGRPGPRLQAFNLASGRTVTLAEMVQTLESALERPAVRDLLPPQAGDMAETWADVELAQRELGLPSAVPFDVGVRQFVDWLKGR